MTLAAVLAGVGVACVGDDPATSPASDAGATEDAPASDARGIDSAIDASPCRLDEPFRDPVLVPNINSAANESAARLSADGLAIYIDSNRRDGGADLWMATRPSLDVDFGAPVLVGGDVDTASYDETQPTVSADGGTLYYGTTAGDATTGYNIFVATRTADGGFSAGVPAPEINAPGVDDLDPWLAPSGNLYFATTRASTQPSVPWDLFVAKPVGAGVFGTPQAVSAVNRADSVEEMPVLTADERTLYFGSTRAGGIFDIYVAQRSTVSDGFGDPRPVEGLNSPALDYPTHVTADGCTLYFVSERAPNVGGRDIWMASRAKR